VLVDSVTVCVLGSVGLDVSSESIPYIAGWGEDGALDAIREYAATIDTIARRIEDAVNPKPEPATDGMAPRAIASTANPVPGSRPTGQRPQNGPLSPAQRK
jgi:hypothetical protein